jgi:hypothetical protein
MSTAGILYFHQGWTDICNSISLIYWYLQTYQHIYVLLRADAKELVSFATENVRDRVTVLPVDKDVLDLISPEHIVNTITFPYPTVDRLYHGQHDRFRCDKYTGAFFSPQFAEACFVRKFYEPYDIPYSVRIDFFNIHRNKELEGGRYRDFTAAHGSNYVLYHEVELPMALKQETPCVNLAHSTTKFFDMITVLEHAKEIHVLDSVWASILYLLHFRHGLFKTIPIHIYCLRGYTTMFEEPRKSPSIHIHLAAAP